ncbi:protein of unknown function [Candidatus Nitrosotalea okcheonensis]|uniref:Uncharacterized protein n=1 Tax=Candidatus Nitrosotalea okcheonensis TaxID=1903276 RepID=A0A2H1FES1_9ARCH|nr:protein of unknown function [Candidatus Nitrosotalea okcheonensis]
MHSNYCGIEEKSKCVSCAQNVVALIPVTGWASYILLLQVLPWQQVLFR